MSKKSISVLNVITSLVSILISVIAIFATYHIFFLDQAKREISVNLNPPVPLVNKEESSTHEFKIFYEDKFLNPNNIYILNGEIINSGNEPIEERDYSKPIKFVFNQDNKLISISSKPEPPEVDMILTKSSDKEALTNKALLNPKDKIYTSFLIESNNYELMTQNLNIEARIKGISQIKKNIEIEDKEDNLLAKMLSESPIIVTIVVAVSVFIEKLTQFIFSDIR